MIADVRIIHDKARYVFLQVATIFSRCGRQTSKYLSTAMKPTLVTENVQYAAEKMAMELQTFGGRIIVFVAMFKTAIGKFTQQTAKSTKVRVNKKMFP